MSHKDVTETIKDAIHWCLGQRVTTASTTQFVCFLASEHERYVRAGMAQQAAGELLAAWFTTGGAWRRFVETHKEPITA